MPEVDRDNEEDTSLTQHKIKGVADKERGPISNFNEKGCYNSREPMIMNGASSAYTRDLQCDYVKTEPLIHYE